MSLLTGEATYIVPSGDGASAPLIIDISAVVQAESRLREVARVNPQTAPEMLAVFNEHWLRLNEIVGKLTLERNIAAGALEDAKAEALLNCNDEVLRKRGHAKTSQDLREAVATLDPTVKAARTRLNEIKAVLSYMEGKLKGFENGYNSVKKLIDGRALPPASLNGPPLVKASIAGPSSDDPPAVEDDNDLGDFEEPVYVRRY